MWNLLLGYYARILLSIFLLCAAWFVSAESLNTAIPEQTGYQSTQPKPLTLQQALVRLQVENPGLAEIQARADAMMAIPSQVGSLPDPMISFNTLNLPVDTFNIDQEAMTQLQFGISQRIPYPGKLALKEQIASYRAKAANSNVEEMHLQLNRDVKTLWWRLFYLDRSLEVNTINKTLLRQFIEIAQTKYKVGQGLQQDVLLAQLELSKLLDRDIQLASRRKQESARLNALLNQPTDQTVQLPSLSNIEVDLPVLKSSSAVFQLAKDNRPSLATQRWLIDAATEQKKLAERDLLPDFNIGASYGIRQGDNPNGDQRSDLFSLKVGITMPLFAERKQKKAISQRHSEVKQQQYALQDQWLTIQADIAATIADYERATEQVVLFKTGVLPQARQTVASMLAGYQVNKVDFLNLIRAQITLYNYETNLWQTISEAKSALAKLVATVGEENIYE
ncbi:MAG: TolC family protein [Gammaproteobacteria bacterium]|nr:TolC family protein [Gammaproteobacteria bacterium]